MARDVLRQVHGPSWHLTPVPCGGHQKPRGHHSHVNDAACLQLPLHTHSFQDSSPKRKAAPEASRGAEERGAEEQGLPEATRCQQGGVLPMGPGSAATVSLSLHRSRCVLGIAGGNAGKGRAGKHRGNGSVHPSAPALGLGRCQVGVGKHSPRRRGRSEPRHRKARTGDLAGLWLGQHSGPPCPGEGVVVNPGPPSSGHSL